MSEQNTENDVVTGIEAPLRLFLRQPRGRGVELPQQLVQRDARPGPSAPVGGPRSRGPSIRAPGP